MSALRQALDQANLFLARRDLEGAERALAPLQLLGQGNHPEVLSMLGSMRLYQGRLPEALALLEKGRAAAPRDPLLALNHARVLAALGRSDEALAVFHEALRLKTSFIEAHFELGQLQHRLGRLDEAEKSFRDLLRMMPGEVHAKLALGAVLLDQSKPLEAETPLRRGLAEAADPRLKAQFQLQLCLALRRQRKDKEALAACDAAQALDPSLPGLALHRAEVLQNLGRHDEALALFETLLKQAPGDPGLHHAYNDLLYRLGRSGEYLKSYDRAPVTRPLLLGKAFFLSHGQRDAEAHAVYADLLRRDPADPVAAMGAANALARLGRHGEAAAAFEAMLRRQGPAPDLCRRAAETALLAGDAQKAAHLCEQGLAQSPRDGNLLALLSIASRMLGDGRDWAINRYDDLVQAIDLEPPQGFARMEDFNAELDAALDRLHPATREFIGQSLRGGTQTADNLFGAGHDLVTRLQGRIDEALQRYIAGLPEDAAHPFLARRARDVRYAGSWSSRLRDCGFHVNHLHPMGWISACYYVAVPGAVEDQAARQGWIKFGEPSLAVTLETPIRRAIQPAPGRLVLFPSYMWHGTIPFRDSAARTTIAFDVVPS